jgi:hypothetical protein
LYLYGIFIKVKKKYGNALEVTKLNWGFTVAGKLCGILCIPGAAVLR